MSSQKSSPGCAIGSLALVFLWCFCIVQAAPFRWSHPVPHGNHIYELAEWNGRIIQLCERGQMYTSTDAETWVPLATGTTNSLRAGVGFKNQFIATGQNGQIVAFDSDFQPSSISLNTGNWMEGIAASSNVVVVVGDQGAIYSSSDARNWQKRGAFTRSLRSVAYGDGLFVAVGEGGFIAQSSDGISWEQRNSGVSVDLNKIAFIANRFWIVGNGGTVLTNTDRQFWVRVNINTSSALYTVSGSTNTIVIAGESVLRARDSRGIWTDQTSSLLNFPAPSWTYYASINAGPFFLVAGQSGMIVSGFREEPTSAQMTWINESDYPRSWLWGVTHLSGLYAAVGSSVILTSEDGRTWFSEAVPPGAADEIFLGVGGTTNLLVAAGSGGKILISPNVSTNVVRTEPDGSKTTNVVSLFGLVWEESNSAVSVDLQGVAATPELFVVTGSGGTILTSANGRAWSRRTSPVTVFLSSVTSYPGGWVASGDRGTILTSGNGINWTVRSSGTTNWLYQVRYLNNQLFAVGQNGTILSSLDGIRWNARASGTLTWLNDINAIGQSYFIAGDDGTLLTSNDTISWSPVLLPMGKSIYGLAKNSNGQLILAGVEGSILRAQITPFTSSVNFLNYDRKGSEFFLFSGEPDQIFTLESSSDLRRWSPVQQLEIWDTSGTLFYERGAATNTMQFYRTRSP